METSEYEDIRHAYEASTKGEYPPTRAVAAGKMLNQLTETQDYDPDRYYVIGSDGIWEYEEY